ncbi:MAG: hypothetical protein IPG06_24995 [Haliea sp.]|nr:hypothetical protein [Haliea sp.]
MRVLIIFIIVGLGLGALPVAAQTQQGCFSGLDATGQPAWIALTAERYGDYFEIYGQIKTTANGVFQLKADGWSGAGRMFRRYEGEADALYISITDYTGSSLMLHVEGFGSFPFQAVAC